MPPNKRIRTGRLCSSIDDQINCLEKDASKALEFVQQSKGRKRNVDESHSELQENLRSIKVIVVAANFLRRARLSLCMEQGPTSPPYDQSNPSH